MRDDPLNRRAQFLPQFGMFFAAHFLVYSDSAAFSASASRALKKIRNLGESPFTFFTA